MNLRKGWTIESKMTAGDILFKLHEFYMSFVVSLTSVSREFGLQVNPITKSFSWLVATYGLSVLVTNFIKTVRTHQSVQQENRIQAGQSLQTCGEQDPVWLQIVLYDYIPCIGTYGKFYHGFIGVMVLLTLGWRIYIEQFKYRGGIRSRGIMDAKRRLLLFFIKEYPRSAKVTPPISADTFYDREPWELVHSLHNDLDSAVDSYFSITGRRRVPKRSNLLSAMHNLIVLNWFTNEPVKLIEHKSLPAEECWFNPLKRYGSLFSMDSPRERWFYMARFFYTFVLFMVAFILVVLHYIWPAHMMIMTLYSGQGPMRQWRNVYGFIEVSFMLFQGISFVCTHQVVLLIYSDIRFGYRKIIAGLDHLCHRYANNLPVNQRKEYFELLRVWHHFDKIIQMDDFVCEFAYVHMLCLVPGVAFGVCFIWIGDSPIRVALGTLVPCAILSFSIGCLLSSDIERQNKVIDKKIRALLSSHTSSEPSLVIKEQWYKLRRGYLTQKDSAHTINAIFTIAKTRPLTFIRLFSIMGVLLSEGVIISRLLHKLGGWDTNFNSTMIETSANSTV